MRTLRADAGVHGGAIIVCRHPRRLVGRREAVANVEPRASQHVRNEDHLDNQLRDAQRIQQALAVVRQVNALDEKLAILRAQLFTCTTQAVPAPREAG